VQRSLQNRLHGRCDVYRLRDELVPMVSLADLLGIPSRSRTEDPLLVIVEAVVRLLPEVLGNPASHRDDSHSVHNQGLLEGPSYTRPPSWRGLDVPQVLLSGDHAKIAAWQHEQGLQRTRERRPDLLD